MILFSKDKVKLIAEIGGNHEGDFNYAVDLLSLAIESKVDSVKFQIYSGETLVNKKVDLERKEHFDKFTLSTEQYSELANICKKNRIDFSASIWNEDQLNKFDEHLSFYKIGSGDLTAFPLIESHCKKGKPIILSTGLSNLNEIKETVDFICKCNPIYKEEHMICIMQCTSSYPTPEDELNLNVLNQLKENFNYTIGFSCHSTNPISIDYSIVLGARIIEFHFTDSRENKEFRDHKVSLTKEDVLDLKERIPFLLKSLGKKEKKPTRSEVDSDHINSFRRAAYPMRDIKQGEKVQLEDFIFLRPQKGIPVKSIYDLLGLKAKRNLQKLEVISKEDFE
ncbi:MAG: N-acetylneuraminate synthase [Candidatus Marinimicrobia bacterium]|nr:N-acetylneuraminate synthase [Candidatus Neomarinimicrobiota bacterium]